MKEDKHTQHWASVVLPYFPCATPCDDKSVFFIDVISSASETTFLSILSHCQKRIVN